MVADDEEASGEALVMASEAEVDAGVIADVLR